jgi:type II secretory pathway component PulF
MKDALGKIRNDVETGLPLSDSLAKHPGIFNRLYIYLVRAGEISGTSTASCCASPTTSRSRRRCAARSARP